MALTKKLAAFEEKHFRDYVERDTRRKLLESEARALAKQNSLIAEDLLEALKENKRKELVRGAYKGSIETKKAAVSWKDEFIRRLGAEVAAEIAADVPEKEFILIEAV